jgi:cytochrome c
LDKASVGPAYFAIAERYAGKEGVVASLSDKIIRGGSGVWGERAMIPHPSLSKDDAAEIVNYILSLTDKSTINRPLNDALVLSDHIGKGIEGSYLLNVSYTDQGANGIEPLQSRSHITLRNPYVQAEDFDEGNVRVATNTTAFLSYARAINHSTYIRFNQIDLTHIKQIKYRAEPQSGGEIEVRLDNPDGPLISTVEIPAGIAKDSQSWKEFRSDLIESKGLHDLYFVFKGQGEKKQNLFNLDWICFSNERK